jgi:hypothetical protein
MEEEVTWKKGTKQNPSDFEVKLIYRKYKRRGGTVPNQRTFSMMLREFHNEIFNQCLNESFVFKIPYGLGTFCIIQKKTKVLNNNGSASSRVLVPDWTSTKELWKNDLEAFKQKIILFTSKVGKNNGYTFRFKWAKPRNAAMNRRVKPYRFILSRSNNLTLKNITNEFGIPKEYLMKNKL